MLQLRTQIYLEPGQHATLLREAKRLGLSLAGMIRKLVDEHFSRKANPPGAHERKRAALGLIGLGASGFADISEKTDRYLAQAVYDRLLRDGPSRKRRPPRKTG